MPLTNRQLNRATLARQLLLERERLPVVDAVHRVLALQRCAFSGSGSDGGTSTSDMRRDRLAPRAH